MRTYALGIVLLLSLSVFGPTALAKRTTSRATRAAALDKLFEQLVPATVTIFSEAAFHRGTGSGVVLHKDGFIATAAHVVEKGMKIIVEFQNGQKLPAKIVTLSRSSDLALLKVPSLPKGLFVPKLADSDKLRVGQKVLAIGAPLGLKRTLTTGIISALRDDFGADNKLKVYPRKVIQTDAAINRGNSGGALFDEQGQVIGIASFIASPSGGSIGLGFAVPSNTVRRRLFERSIPYIGVGLRRISKPLAAALHWPYSSVLLIEQVKYGTPAAKAGLRGGVFEARIGFASIQLGGDLIVKVGGFPIEQATQVHEYLHRLKKGDSIRYTVVRAGKERNIDVVLKDLIAVPTLKY